MKKKLIGLVLLLSVVMGTACAESPQIVPLSSVVSSQPSGTVSKTADTGQESGNPEESSQASVPAYPGENLPDIPLKAADYEKLVTAVAKLDLTIIDSVPTTDVWEDDSRFNLSTLTLTVNAEWEGMTAFLQTLIKQEKNNIFLDKLTIEKDPYSGFNCTVTIMNLTPVTEEESAPEDAQQVIKSRFCTVERQKMLDAFLGLHANYSMQYAACTFTVDANRQAAVDVIVDFLSYKGFVSYRYKINSSEDFTVNKDVRYEQKSDDSEMPFRVVLTLYSDKFTV